MQPDVYLTQPGEHALSLEGGAGVIEAVLTVPPEPRAAVAFLGHPNSLQGGSMQNKVVTTMARAFRDAGVPSLRLNFRGVGRSEGAYDNGIGESEDLLALARHWQEERPGDKTVFAGFSFGSWVTYRVAARLPHAQLFSIAPPVDRYDFKTFTPAPSPWDVFMGDADEVVDFAEVEAFCTQENLPLHRFQGTGHFFHGKLLLLRDAIAATLAQRDIP
ncbi:hypothetical protein E3226_006730 [Legionella geestiana]|uniref:alpha/beta hydrolase n=1 Tax=Legionella geestiana TaxID=45065 RepID=UPI001092B5A3|nr:hypothetical protein [Legionella geestiana]QDQ40115.1 hypothetical protein E3226_006730 [Legionella geestiana]